MAALAIVLGVLEALVDHPQRRTPRRRPELAIPSRRRSASLNNVSVAVRAWHDLAARAKARDAYLVALFATDPGGSSAHGNGP